MINQGHITQKRNSIENYYKSPKICKQCGSVIMIGENQKAGDVRRKQFCNQSCAGLYNNANRKTVSKSGILSFVDQFSDDEFICLIKTSKDIKEISMRLGYKNYYSKIGGLIKDRVIKLKVDKYLPNNNIPLSKKTKFELYLECKNNPAARSAITKNASSIYKKSNKPKYCIKCGYNKYYEVCHKKAVADFGKQSLIGEINHIDNLMALCPNCHWEYDNRNKK